MSGRNADRKNGGQLETLDDLSKAVNYNKWIFDLIKPHLGKRVLEVGCGTGNIIQYMTHKNILGVDIEKVYINIAKERFKNKKNIKFQLFDLGKSLGSFKKFKPDTIICINVLEHIEKDEKFIKECESLLSPGGKLIIFVPAMPSLYGEMDKTYGHFRRYTKSEVVQKLRKKFKVENGEYLNISGIFGWWLNGKILKRKIIPQDQMMLYDRVFKYVFMLEKIIPKPFGLSVFVVGEKTSK